MLASLSSLSPSSSSANWPTKSFAGETAYRLVERDGVSVLEARSRGQASARYLERDIDLGETPYLRWCWQVSGVYSGVDERTESGDDYPARVYVARRTGLLPWQVRRGWHQEQREHARRGALPRQDRPLLPCSRAR